MKKIIAAALCAALVLSFAGCSKRKKQQDAAGTTAESASAVTDVRTTEAQTSATAVTSADTVIDRLDGVPTALTCRTETFNNGNNTVTLKYPVFDDASHSDADGAIRDFVRGRYTSAGMFPEEFAAYEITDVEVTYAGERFVSALFVGQIIGENGEEHFAYTLNLGLSPVRVCDSSELVASAASLYDSFVSGAFALVRGNSAVSSDMTASDIAYSFRPELGVCPNVYLRGDALGIVCDVAQVYGGYAAFECDAGALGGVISDTAAALVAE